LAGWLLPTLILLISIRAFPLKLFFFFMVYDRTGSEKEHERAPVVTNTPVPHNNIALSFLNLQKKKKKENSFFIFHRMLGGQNAGDDKLGPKNDERPKKKKTKQHAK
jgi:hypothetical protein